MFDIKECKFKVLEESQTYGKFEFGPLPRGYGNTIGTPLRRVLLSSIPGAAITSVKLKGAQHEFSTLEGVKDDVLRMLLKLKKVVVLSYSDKPQTLTLDIKGLKTKGQEVTAGDIKTTESTEIFNEDLVITSLSGSKANLKMEMIVETGTGYVLADQDKRSQAGVIPIDANFSPIERVQVDVFQTRFGQQTDLDQLIVEVWTKGSISPKAALRKGLEICSDTFSKVTSVVKSGKSEKKKWGTKGGTEDNDLVCPKCGKEYKSKAYFDKHVKSCNG